nr:cytochrome b/b6 domain-containing protein [Wolbachia endosymbiont of Atemnus politus]
MKSLPVSNEIKFSIYTFHKACGVTILGLILVRIFFRVFTCVPSLPANFSHFEVNASKAVDFCLYSLIILIPLSVYVMSSASGIKIKYLFYIPLLISKNKELSNTANGLHSMLSYIIIFFITLHILAALKRTFIDKQNASYILYVK